jgi:signal peptidase
MSTGRRAARPDTASEKSLARYLGTAVMAALLVALAAVAALVIVVPAVSGASALTVLTSSMAPKFPPGTLLVVRPTEVDDIAVGQVLTYQIESGRPAVVAHRVVERSVELDGSVSFTTKGDNNAVADPDPVREVQVKGTLWYAIPLLGWINNVVTGESRAVLVPVAAVLLFAYTAYLVVGYLLHASRRKKRRGQGPRKAATR